MRLDIIGAMKGLSKIWAKEIDDYLIEIWHTVLSDLTAEELRYAVEKYVKYGPNFFPSPGELFKLARPEANKESEASRIADRIAFAVSSYPKDKSGAQRAKDKIGPVGWQHVMESSSGNWEGFVDSWSSVEDLPRYKAQARKSIVGILEQTEKEQVTRSIQILDQTTNKKGLTAAEGFIPKLVKKSAD